MYRLIPIAAVTVLGGACLACGTEPVSREPEPAASEGSQLVDLEGVEWRLWQYSGKAGEMSPALEGATVGIEFDGVEMGGTSGCNRFFGRYVLNAEGRLTIDPEIGSTQMACAPEVMEQESRFLALLNQTVRAEREDGEMRLFDESGETLLWFKVAEPLTLENIQWRATGINNGEGGVVTSVSTSASTATFDGGRISGHAGCNRYMGTYRLEGDDIDIEVAAVTEAFCDEPEGMMEQERQFLEALARSRTLSLTSEKLELRDENGSLQAGFRVAEEQ